MPTYTWKSTTKSGHIEACNRLHAKIKLRKQGINATSIKRYSALLEKLHKRRLSSREFQLALQQLYTFLNSGIDLQQALQLLISSSNNLQKTQLFSDIQEKLQQGFSLTEACQQHRRYFSEYICQLIQVGEETGTLEQQLHAIMTQQQRLQQVKSNLIKALTYPCLVAFAAIVITAVLLHFVVPQFADIFSDAGSQLPKITQLIIQLSNNTERFLLIIAITAITLFSTIYLLNRYNSRCRYYFHQTLLRIPIIKKAILARNCQILATLLQAGIPITESCQMLIATNGNSCYKLAFTQIKSDIERGYTLSESCQTPFLFPPLLQQLIITGEHSGKLEQMLQRGAIIFETAIDQQLEKINILLEPIIMIILAGIIGTIVIALYLPIFNLGNIL